jgi:hypothetical protein
VGQTLDVARIALRLPALCGAPTREEAEQVGGISVARQHEMTEAFTSLTKQRREVLGHVQDLESLGQNQGAPHVELLPGPKNRSNHAAIVNLSTDCETQYVNIRLSHHAHQKKRDFPKKADITFNTVAN